jgi:3-keto-disaccharide hydrolase
MFWLFLVMWLLALEVVASSNVVASAPAIRASPELARMKVLFDGRSLEGWEYNSNAWTLVDGAMRGTGKGGNIFTRGDYGDFRLIVTSRVASPEGNPGRDHLGVLFWGERSTNFGTGKALQVQPPHGAMWDYRTNKGLRPEHPAPRPRPRYQDWHVCEILAKLKTGEVRAAVDGVEITKYKHPDPGVLRRGPIGMQIHGSVGIFEYKDIRIDPDPKDARLITVE